MQPQLRLQMHRESLLQQLRARHVWLFRRLRARRASQLRLLQAHRVLFAAARLSSSRVEARSCRLA